MLKTKDHSKHFQMAARLVGLRHENIIMLDGSSAGYSAIKDLYSFGSERLSEEQVPK